jgi:predicted kinase
VGKTSVCRVLADSMPGTVTIRGDDLRAFAPDDARAHLGGGSTYRAGGPLAMAYLRMGATRVVFDYVFLRRSHVQHFRRSVDDPDTAISMFTLWAPLDVIQRRELGRPDRRPLGVAVRECWEEMDENRVHLGEFIDTSARDATAVAAALAAACSLLFETRSA